MKAMMGRPARRGAEKALAGDRPGAGNAPLLS